ncbi:hypothetical protein [Ramlibacter sp. WS9]|uniref:hypothetical protein n=1 Tax=Ramlibacter sp. WS9 TaxID=1882741 RepID=UPI00130529C5|nr:hypothetical protein [Ramlibacter sp. WS9]
MPEILLSSPRKTFAVFGVSKREIAKPLPPAHVIRARSRARARNARQAHRSDLGDYFISFSPQSHEGASFVDTAIVSATGVVRR